MQCLFRFLGCTWGSLCLRVCTHTHRRVCDAERRRSAGLWRNEGVQGQSEGTGLFSQPADEELIQGEISSRLRGRNKKRSLFKEDLSERKKKSSFDSFYFHFAFISVFTNARECTHMPRASVVQSGASKSDFCLLCLNICLWKIVHVSFSVSSPPTSFELVSGQVIRLSLFVFTPLPVHFLRTRGSKYSSFSHLKGLFLFPLSSHFSHSNCVKVLLSLDPLGAH